MRLVRASIENFKLLEDVTLDFSIDPERPLTVIRAENGSGKTSVLNALRWAMHGSRGLPEEAQSLRLTSSAARAGVPIEVSVRLEFEHLDDNGLTTRYRLIRSITETPTAGDKVHRPSEARLRLLRLTPAGEEEVASAGSLLGKLLPLRLRDVFFTDGDAVQTFITARRVSSQQSQDKVQRSIRLLLGLDAMRTAADDLSAILQRLRGEAARSGGQDTETLQKALEDTDAKLTEQRARHQKLIERLDNMTEQKTKLDRELTALRGNGDLEDINRRLEQARADVATQERARDSILTRMRQLISSPACSWAFLDPNLRGAISQLEDLADRNIIPGTAAEVLVDRLELEECICGENLRPGSEHRQHVEELLAQQRTVSEQNEQLTSLWHQARTLQGNEDADREASRGFEDRRRGILDELTDVRDLLARRTLEIKDWEERRAGIDEARVQNLTSAIARIDHQIADTTLQLGEVTGEIARLEERHTEQESKLEAAERAAKMNEELLTRRDVARDLQSLAASTLQTLEGDYVQRVSDRMSGLFMQIVGSDPEFEAGVFTGVRLDDRYNIVVDTHHGRSLDTDFELNGASQRALTLAFIWALMEVSGTRAPRTIDTPLGMVAGGVKTRMVDTITSPAAAPDTADFQVILLLTRSEIRDVEDLLDDRAGVVRTLSCSKDYPEDLRFSWDVDHPLVRACTCNHRQSCRLCARRYDSQHNIDFRDTEAAV